MAAQRHSDLGAAYADAMGIPRDEAQRDIADMDPFMYGLEYETEHRDADAMHAMDEVDSRELAAMDEHPWQQGPITPTTGEGFDYGDA